MDKRESETDSEGFQSFSLEKLQEVFEATSRELDAALEKAKKIDRKQKHAYEAVTDTVKYLKDRLQKLEKVIAVKKRAGSVAGGV